jgi:hypothetical protein
MQTQTPCSDHVETKACFTLDVQQSDYRKTETPDMLKTFSPITYLQKDPSKIPPLFIGRARRDEVPTMDDSIDRFVHEALAKNAASPWRITRKAFTRSTIKTMTSVRVRSFATPLPS